MPHLSAKSVADTIVLPSYQLLRVLHEQKYPRQAPNSYKVHYYAQAKSIIRQHYAGGSNAAATRQAATRLVPKGPKDHMTGNNQRAVLAFLGHPAMVTRLISPSTAQRRAHSSNGVDFGLQFDLEGVESNTDRFVFYNYSTVPIDDETARVTCEVAHWILSQTGHTVPIKAVEYCCTASGKTHRFASARPGTIKRVGQTAKMITQVWPAV